MLTDGVILLRAPEPSDIDAMYLWENDPQIWAEGTVRAPMSRQMLHDFVMCYNPDPNSAGQLRLIIEEKQTHEAVGCVDLYEYDAVNRRAGVGIVIMPQWQRQGLAARALNLMACYCHESLGLRQLWAIAGCDNTASRSLFERCGYRPCGTLRSWIRRGTTFTNALMYQLLLT